MLPIPVVPPKQPMAQNSQNQPLLAPASQATIPLPQINMPVRHLTMNTHLHPHPQGLLTTTSLVTPMMTNQNVQHSERSQNAATVVVSDWDSSSVRCASCKNFAQSEQGIRRPQTCGYCHHFLGTPAHRVGTSHSCPTNDAGERMACNSWETCPTSHK